MTNANSFHSALFVLVLFGVLYFAALAIYEIREYILRRKKKKEDE